MTRGEDVLVLEDYDLFDKNMKDCRGIYIKTDQETGKFLIYFPINQEWADMSPDILERLDPDKVSKENFNFIKNVKTMVYTFES